VKTLRLRVLRAAKDGNVSQLVAERDYAQSYVLLGIAANDLLRESLVFKGGTALRKVHFPGYRFSEDLDFSMVAGPRGDDLERALRAAIGCAEEAARKLAPLVFTLERGTEREPHPGGQETFVVRAQFPWQSQPIVPVKIEIAQDEPVLLPAPPRAVAHGYGEPFEASVRTYGLEEICAEKLRSTRQTHAVLAANGWARSRAQDYYDLWHLVRAGRETIDWSSVAAILPAKCAHRGVALRSVRDVFEPQLLEEIRATWQRTLVPFVRELPPVDRVLTETREDLEALLRL
jgi:predicted nucleotidyltransferase component of viral defense system